MIKRLGIYFREMFPLQKYVPYIFVTFSAIYGITQICYHPFIEINKNFWGGLGIVFFATLLMRNYDEWKDKETDALHFPHRALPRGAVLYTDVQFLIIFNWTAILLITIFITHAYLSTGALLLYGWLTFKWFFIPKKMSKNLPLAFVTHQPYVLFVYVVIISSAIPDGIQQIYWYKVLPSVIALFLTVSTWEVSRKIRSEDQETAYVTYTKLFGVKKPTLFAMIALLFGIGLDTLAGFLFSFDWWFYVTYLILGIIYAFYFIRFILNPIKENANLKPVAEAAGICIPLVYIIQLLLHYSIV